MKFIAYWIASLPLGALLLMGHYSHSWIGIGGTSHIPKLATAMNLDRDQRGALVVDVLANSPAQASGPKGSGQPITLDDQRFRVDGDVIGGIDGQPVNGFDDLVSYLVRNTSVGQQSSFSILHDGQSRTISLTLAARPGEEAATPEPEQSSIHGRNLGLRIEPSLALSGHQSGRWLT